MKRRMFCAMLSLCLMALILAACGKLPAADTETQAAAPAEATEKIGDTAQSQSVSETLPASADNSSQNNSKQLKNDYIGKF